MMNNEMMRQLQARIQKMQDDLASQTVEASAGGGAVTVTISEIGMGPAQAKVQRVKISPEAVDPEDIEGIARALREMREGWLTGVETRTLSDSWRAALSRGARVKDLERFLRSVV